MSVAYDLDLGATRPQRAPSRPVSRPLALVPSLVPALVPSGVPAARPGAPVALPAARAVPVSVLRPLHDPVPLRLTRRGVVVLGLALAMIGLVVVLVGALSARSATPTPVVGPAVVTVQAGDTLWSIASHAAPGEDPRAEIATIHRLNSLRGEALVPGQRLRVR